MTVYRPLRIQALLVQAGLYKVKLRQNCGAADTATHRCIVLNPNEQLFVAADRHAPAAYTGPALAVRPHVKVKVGPTPPTSASSSPFARPSRVSSHPSRVARTSRPAAAAVATSRAFRRPPSGVSRLGSHHPYHRRHYSGEGAVPSRRLGWRMGTARAASPVRAAHARVRTPRVRWAPWAASPVRGTHAHARVRAPRAASPVRGAHARVVRMRTPRAASRVRSRTRLPTRPVLSRR
jgi:hypothetical protein